MATFNVNNLGDGVDANVGDGICAVAGPPNVCTLRAAIQESNADATADTINLPAGTIQLTLLAADEDLAAAGDLDIRQPLSLLGQGAASSIVDGGGIDRVLHVLTRGVTIRGVTIRNGSAKDFGGGIFNDQAAQPGIVGISIDDVSVSANLAGVNGGGIFNRGSLELENSILDNNRAVTGSGGGLFNAAGASAIGNRVTIQGNRAEQNGGGVANQGTLDQNAPATLNLSDSTVTRNTAAVSGGGIYLDRQAFGSQAFLFHSTIDTNSAATQGGGILIQTGSALQATNSTISTNQAFSGGGVFNAGDADFLNATIAANSADSLGANAGNLVTQAPSGNSRLRHTVIADGQFGGNCSGASPISNGNNLDSDSTCNLNGAGDISDRAARLGPLQDNGGPTFTHLPLAGSPLIDGGLQACVNPFGQLQTADQRGSPRPVDGNNDGTTRCDIGAVEVASAATGSISGTKFLDPNGDGFGPDDVPRAGVRIELYRDNGDQQLDPAVDPLVAFQTTGANGTYTFGSLIAATYFVIEVIDTDTEVQSAGGNSGSIYVIHLLEGENSTGNNFANFELFAISGRKFNDLNGDGDDEGGGDPGLAGVVIFLDRNGNDVLDAIEERVQTLGDGTFRFEHLVPGDYRVREVVPANSIQTTTPPAEFTVQSGQDVANILFGNFRLIDISGRKYNDLNGDGTNQSGGIADPGFDGVTVFLDRDSDGVLDAGEPSTVTSGNGRFLFPNQGPGVHRVREVVPANAIQTATPADIVVVSGTNVDNADIGNFIRIEISGRKFSDLNRDGDDEGGSDPDETDVTIFLDNDGDGILDAAEPRTTTDANGTYVFSGLGPGTYRVREVTPANSVQTTANPAPIVASSGQNVTRIDFGNFRNGLIQGQKFEDRNANGVQDAGELGLDGRTIELVDRSTNQVVATQITASVDLNNDAAIDPETEQGIYVFAGVNLGDYDVREVQQSGWEQTAPRFRFAVDASLNASVAATGSQTADLDNDNDGDLVVVNDVTGEILAYFNDGTGQFSAAIQLAVAVRPQDLDIADLNGDGAPDIVVVSVGATGSTAANSNVLLVLMNDGTGDFSRPTLVRAGNGPIAVAVGDVNRDGTDDLAVANFRSSTISIFHSNRAGVLTLAQTLSAATEPLAVAFGDIDGDNDLDLAATSFSSDLVTTWINPGTGKFQIGEQLATGDGPAAIELADLNNDSRDDLIVANHLADDVLIYFAAANGFANPVPLELPADAHPKAVAALDVNDDGVIDIVSSNSGINTVTVFYRHANGAFGAPLHYPAGTGPESIDFGDWDQDGDVDLAVANYAGSSLSILTNGPGTFRVTVDTSGVVLRDLDFGNVRSLVVVEAEGEFPFSNGTNPVDVSGDGMVSPMDALLVINQLNDRGPRRLLLAEGESATRSVGGVPFIDANRDNWLTPIDALLVINALNNTSAGEGERPIDASVFSRESQDQLGDEQEEDEKQESASCAVSDGLWFSAERAKGDSSSVDSGDEQRTLNSDLLELLAQDIADQM